MHAPPTRSQRAARFAMATAMFLAGALVGIPQTPGPASPVEQKAPQLSDQQVAPNLVSKVEAAMSEGATQ